MRYAYTNDDRIPHDQAVWRDHDGSDVIPGNCPLDAAVGLDYGGGHFLVGFARDMRWQSAKRWRFGWPPR